MGEDPRLPFPNPLASVTAAVSEGAGLRVFLCVFFFIFIFLFSWVMKAPQESARSCAFLPARRSPPTPPSDGPLCLASGSDTWGGGRGVSENRPPGRAKDPKGWRWPCACWPGKPEHISPVTTFVPRPRYAHVRSPSSSSSAAGRTGSRSQEASFGGGWSA